MKIAYVSRYYPWWGHYPPSVLDEDRGYTVGGGEAGMLESAFGLAGMGHSVKLWSCAISGEYRGVAFRPDLLFHREFHDFDADALVSWADPGPLKLAPEGCARVLVQQLNDLIYYAGWERDVDVLVSPSQSHLEFMRKLGWAAESAVMHNGCWPDRWAPFAVPAAQRPTRIGYWSSPDRGLHHTLRVWPRVRAACPDAELFVAYEIERLFGFLADPAVSNRSRDRIAEVQDRVRLLQNDPRVRFSGAISRTRLIEEQSRCRVQAYPCDGIGFVEGFCVASLEACAAGVLPILRPVDALPSLYSGVTRWLPEDTGDPGFDDAFVDEIIAGLRLNWSGITEDALRARAAEFQWSRAHAEISRAIDRAVSLRRS